jgi:hypothetical protein
VIRVDPSRQTLGDANQQPLFGGGEHAFVNAGFARFRGHDASTG